MDERIAILETKMEIMEDSHIRMESKIDTLIENMNKSKGFWAGVVAAGTALGAALGALISYILQLKGGS